MSLERKDFEVRQKFVPPRISDEEVIAALKAWGIDLDGANRKQAVTEGTIKSTKKVSQNQGDKRNSSRPKGRIDLGRKDVRLGKQWY